MPESMLGTFLYHLLPDFSRQGLSLNGEHLTRLLGQHVRGTACLCLPSVRVIDTHHYAGEFSSGVCVSRTGTLSAESSPQPHAVILLKSRTL